MLVLVCASDAAYPEPFELSVARECLACGAAFPATTLSPPGLVVVLGQLLLGLPRPLLPPWLLPTSSLAAKSPDDDDSVVLHTQQMRSFCKKMLHQLPPAHYNAFVHVMSYQRMVLAHSTITSASGSRNGVNVQILSEFGTVCMARCGDPQQQTAVKEMMQFLLVVTDLHI